MSRMSKGGQLEVGIGQLDIPLSNLLWAWRPSHGIFIRPSIIIKITRNIQIMKNNESIFFLSLYKSATDCSIVMSPDRISKLFRQFSVSD